MLTHAVELTDTALLRHESRPEIKVPSPLHIIKRPESRWSQMTSSSRDSIGSANSDVSVGSMPEPPGGDRPLTVTKRRGNNNTSSFTTRPTRSASCTDPRQVESAEVVPQLSNKASLFFLGRRQMVDGVASHNDVRMCVNSTPAIAAQNRPLHNSPWLQNSRDRTHMTTTSRDSRNGIPISHLKAGEPEGIGNFAVDSCPLNPFVLVPRIVVTPDCKFLDEGVTALWAAVQVSTQIFPASSPDQVPHNSDFEPISAGCQSNHTSSPSGAYQTVWKRKIG